MNGPHDLGGRMGFGDIAPDPDEPQYHAPWESRAMAITLTSGALGHWTIDESRHARESIPHADYLRFSYYKIWLTALENLLQRHGEVTADELKLGEMQQPGLRAERALKAAAVPAVLTKGGPSIRPNAAVARFAIGDSVRCITQAPETHTRLPSYANGAVGVIEHVHDAYVFPDSNAHGGGEAPQILYTVVFEGTALWGKDAQRGLSVTLDLWDSYLDPA